MITIHNSDQTRHWEPAAPHFIPEHSPSTGATTFEQHFPGLSKLEHFAGLALQGLCIGGAPISSGAELDEALADKTAKLAVLYAKSIIAALNEK